MRKHEQSEIQRLAEEKAKKVAKKEATAKHFTVALPFWLPLWVTAMILALTGRGSSIVILFLCLAAIFVHLMAYFITKDQAYTKYYQTYLKELSPTKKEEE